MRLIDADALIRAMRADPLYFVVEQYNVEGPIHAAPTIDAVPVEWIKRWSKEPMTEKDMKLAEQCEWNILEWLIADWHERKEE